MATYGTTDRCTGGTAFGTTYDTTNTWAKAFDDNESTYFYGSTSPATIGYQFATAWKISKVMFKSSETNDNPNAFTIQGSNNGTDYTTLYTGNGSGGTGFQTFTFTNRIPYLYIKMVVTTIQAAGTYCRVNEMQMYEGIYPNQAAISSNPIIL